MNEVGSLVQACILGCGIGAVFFGGLMWTVRRALASPRPALWFLCSLVLRMSLVLAGLYVIGAGNWERLAVGVLGILIARVTVTGLTRQVSDAS